MMYLLPRNLLNAGNALDQPVDPFGFLVRYSDRGLHQAGPAFENGFTFSQPVGGERSPRGDQVADHLCATQAGSDLNGAAEFDHLAVQVVPLQVVGNDQRIAGRDGFAVDVIDVLQAAVLRIGEGEAAVTEVQRLQHFERLRYARGQCIQGASPPAR